MEASPLGSLPAELRNEIYKLTLRQPELIHLRPDKDRARVPTKVLRRYDPIQGTERRYSVYAYPKNILALAQTCKQARDESHMLFFAINKFDMTAPDCSGFRDWTEARIASYRNHLVVCTDWLSLIGEHNAKAITSLAVGPAPSSAWLEVINQKISPPAQASWWKAARKVERRILAPMLAPNTTYQYMQMRLEMLALSRVRGLLERFGLIDESQFGLWTLVFSTTNGAALVEEIEPAFARDREALRTYVEYSIGLRNSYMSLMAKALHSLKEVEEWLRKEVEGC